MTNAASPDVYIGRNAVDPQGNKIGSVGQVYLNDETGQPDWITVNTGPVRDEGELRPPRRVQLQR